MIATKYLTLVHSDEKYERYLIILKRNISETYSHKYMKTKINSKDDVKLHNAIILITSVFNKNYNHHYYQVYLKLLVQIN